MSNTDTLVVTGTFGGAWALYYLWLYIRVVLERRASNCHLGDGTIDIAKQLVFNKGQNQEEIDVHKYDRLVPAIRAHANFYESAPFILILTMVMELQGVNRIFLTVLLSLYSLGRLLYTCIGIGTRNNRGWGRFVGSVITVATLLIFLDIYNYLNKKTKPVVISDCLYTPPSRSTNSPLPHRTVRWPTIWSMIEDLKNSIYPDKDMISGFLALDLGTRELSIPRGFN
eukprot:gene4278-4994_t